VRVLLVSSRFPWPPYTGDRLRLLIWVEALADHDLTLVSPPGRVPSQSTKMRHIAARSSLREMAMNIAVVAKRGVPFHSLIAARRQWREALKKAHADASYDVTIVFLSRFDPLVYPYLTSRRRILEAIDSLALSSAERSRHSRGPVSLFWKREAQSTAVLERDVPSRYEAIVVVSEEEKKRFGSNAVAIPNGVEILPLERGGFRPFTFGFWGRLAYFANRDAVSLIFSTIWPSIRLALPDARLLLAGADAPESFTRYAGSDGVELISPLQDRPEMLRRVQVALFPLRFGTGQSNKVLEAAEAGCAIVATHAGVRGLDDLAPLCILEDDPARLAEKAVELAKDHLRVERLGAELRMMVEERYDRRRTLEALRQIVTAGGSEV